MALATFLSVLWFILCWSLSNEWSVNEQYSYGWFVPLFTGYLLWIRWNERPALHTQRCDHAGHRIARVLAACIAVGALVALFPIRLFELANQDWRLLGWLHVFSVLTFTLVVIHRAGGTPWLRHFAFPTCFFVVAVPWITPVEEPLVQGLMKFVAGIATEAVTLFGIPAQLDGNVIRISSGLVGVNEACSGVRSLQTSIMIGMLFGELKRLTIWGRILLVGGAVLTAFIANCARAFFLVWIAASGGGDAASRWHDTLGYTILAVVFLATIFIANSLATRGGRAEIREARPMSSAQLPEVALMRLLPLSFIVASLFWLLAIEIGAGAWYSTNERKLLPRERWSVRWPDNKEGYRELSINVETKNLLRYDEGKEVTWLSRNSDSVAQVFLFFFRWKPGGETAVRARSHRPDVCLPSVGWRRMADHGVRRYPVTKRLELPFRHFSFAHEISGERVRFAEAFFCVREDRVLPRDVSSEFLTADVPVSDWSRAERVRVVREGLRNTGQQVLEVAFISENAMSGTSAEERLAEMLPNLIQSSPDE